jgi:hypothetical protein
MEKKKYAVLGVTGTCHYDGYGDSEYTYKLDSILSDDWIEFTDAEKKVFVANKQDIANKLGYDQLLLISKLEQTQRHILNTEVMELIAKAEEATRKRLEKAEKARLTRLADEKDKKLKKAQDAIDRNLKLVEELSKL